MRNLNNHFRVNRYTTLKPTISLIEGEAAHFTLSASVSVIQLPSMASVSACVGEEEKVYRHELPSKLDRTAGDVMSE